MSETTQLHKEKDLLSLAVVKTKLKVEVKAGYNVVVNFFFYAPGQFL